MLKNKKINFDRVFILSAWLLISIFSLIIFTKNNHFPYFYHPDEPGKVYQVKENRYNLHHPLLMLNSARIAVFFTGSMSSQEIVEDGRLISALFSVLSVIMLMIIAHRFYGIFAAISAGAVTACAPILIKTSHFFKEDTSLLFGFAAAFLAFSFYDSIKNNITSLILAGAAAALAASGKYVGIIILPAALILILRKDNRRKLTGRTKRVFVFLLTFFITFSFINYQIFFYTDYIKKKILQKYNRTVETKITGNIKLAGLSGTSGTIAAKKKSGKVTTPAKSGENFSSTTVTSEVPSTPDKGGFAILVGHGGVISKNSLKQYINMFFTQNSFIISILSLVYLLILIIRRRKFSLAEKLIPLSVILYFITISLGKAVGPRYMLPVSVMGHYFAVLAVINAGILINEKINYKHLNIILSVAMAAIFIVTLNFSARQLKTFDLREDNRKDMVKWIESNIKERAVIASDSYARLPQLMKGSFLTKNKTVEIREMIYTGDLKSLANARERGITHIVACTSSYTRFFNKSNIPHKGSESIVSIRKKFYTELFKKGRLIWKSRFQNKGFMSPGLKLYRIVR